MKNANTVDLGCQKARARKAEHVHSNMTRQRKERQRESIKKLGLKRPFSRTTICQCKKKIVLRVSTTKEEIVVTIESLIIGIFHIANTSRKTHVKWDRIVHAYTSKKKNSKEKLTVAIVNIANH